MISTTILSDCLKWIKKGIGKNETKRNLMNIEFKQSPDSIRIRSSNFHIILSETIQTKDAEELTFYLDLKEIVMIEKLLKVLEDDSLVFFTSVNDQLKISIGGILEKNIKESVLADNWNFDELFYQKSLILDPGRLKLGSKLLKICLDGFCEPLISFTGDLKPVILSEKKDYYDRTALIMPVRTNKETV